MLTSEDALEQSLNTAAQAGDLDALKRCYKLHKHELHSKHFSSGASSAMLKKHFHCLKYLIDLSWHTFSDENKCFLLKIAAFTASEQAQLPEVIRENTKALAYFLKKYTPTFPEGTVRELKKHYSKAFENLQNPHAQKMNNSFLPMFKNSAEKKNQVKKSYAHIKEIKKPLALVHLLEEDCRAALKSIG